MNEDDVSLKMVQINIKIPITLRRELKIVSVLANMNMSEIAIQAFWDYVAKAKKEIGTE